MRIYGRTRRIGCAIFRSLSGDAYERMILFWRVDLRDRLPK